MSRDWITGAVGAPMFERLARELSGSELQSVLLEVMRARAQGRAPRDVLAQYHRDRFVRPSTTDQRRVVEIDGHLLAAAAGFDALELSPLAPLGTCSTVALTDQHRVVTALRGTEVVSDPTNVLALECAERLRDAPGDDVHLTTSMRVVRAQPVPKRPGFAQHFRIWVLASAGRERAGHGFTVAALRLHLETMLRALDRLEQHGCAFGARRIDLLARDDAAGIADRVAAAFPGAVRKPLDHAYYAGGVRAMLWITTPDGDEVPLGDTGVFDWMPRLTANHRHAFVASGLGAQLIAHLFRVGWGMRIACLLVLVAACGGDDGAVVDHDAAPGADASDPLAGIGDVELVAGGYMFVEGPQWLEERGTLVFSDIPASTIRELTLPSAIATFRMPSNNSNGLGVLPDGRLIAGEHGTRRVSVSAADGTGVTTLVDAFEGSALNSPNDVIAAADGTVYFTDPPYGIADADRELDFMGIFRVPAGATAPLAEWRGALTARPNGLGLSPSGDVLYVDDTDEGVVRAFDVGGDGALSGERTLSTDTPNADGLTVDVDGNLYVATAAGIRVLSPDGATLGTIVVAEQPANCAFGDADHRTLYITARTGLYRVRVAVPGLI